MSGGPPSTGAPAAIGLAESRRSLPPCGATRMPKPDVLTKWKETRPASASCSAQAPMRPRWPALRMAMMAKPPASALAQRRAPSPPCRSPGHSRSRRRQAAAAPRSMTISTWRLGSTRPACAQSTYFLMRMTPCESWPTRLASTRWSAIDRGLAFIGAGGAEDVLGEGGQPVRRKTRRRGGGWYARGHCLIRHLGRSGASGSAHPGARRELHRKVDGLDHALRRGDALPAISKAVP